MSNVEEITQSEVEASSNNNAIEEGLLQADNAPEATLSAADGDTDPTVDDLPFEEDGRADKALDFVVEVLTKMGMDCTVDLMENEPEDPPSDIRIEIIGNDAHRLVGKNGQTLSALQFLTNRVINRPTLPHRHIIIDSDVGSHRNR